MTTIPTPHPHTGPEMRLGPSLSAPPRASPANILSQPSHHSQRPPHWAPVLSRVPHPHRRTVLRIPHQVTLVLYSTQVAPLVLLVYQIETLGVYHKGCKNQLNER